MLLILIVLLDPSSLEKRSEATKDEQHQFGLIKLTIDTFRTLVIMISCVCILAVDFFVFPSKHVKTLRYGFSLMDIGVGYFILCHSMRVVIKNEFEKDGNNPIAIREM